MADNFKPREIKEGGLSVEYIDIAELVPYARNAKKHSDEQVAQIANSIKRFGFNDPVGVWTNASGRLEIVEGHGRVLALDRLGVAKCPIIKLDDLSDEERRAYTHIHNQTTLTSDFDEEILFMDIDELDMFNWESFGFPATNVDDFGTDFSLPDEDAPQFKTVSMHMTTEQYEIWEEFLEEIDGYLEGDEGNKPARAVCEVIGQWREQKMSNSE